MRELILGKSQEQIRFPDGRVPHEDDLEDVFSCQFVKFLRKLVGLPLLLTGVTLLHFLNNIIARYN